MSGYSEGAYYETGCRSCGHAVDQHDQDNLCLACSCPGWLDQPTLAERIISPIDEARSIQATITAEQWVLPMHAAQRIAMVLDDLANGREQGDRFGGASLLQYLPRTDPKPPCGAIAPIPGGPGCDNPQGHRGKHHVAVGQYNPYDVHWTTP
jgi:hypothetical protein